MKTLQHQYNTVTTNVSRALTPRTTSNACKMPHQAPQYTLNPQREGRNLTAINSRVGKL